MTTMTDRHLDVGEIAQLVRRRLRSQYPQFPARFFSVRSERYSMGSSVTVYWRGGPLQRDVQAIVEPYDFTRFDGMTDHGWNVLKWLTPSGEVTLARDPENRLAGMTEPPCLGAELVYAGSVVFATRLDD